MCTADECAGNQSDHFVKKTRAGKFELDQIASGGDAKRIDRPCRVLGELATCRREIAEIMTANEQPRCAYKGCSIQWCWDMPGPAQFERGHDGGVTDAIAVDFSFGGETGMEIQ